MPVWRSSCRSMRSLFNTNLKGAYFTIQKALPLLNDGGAVILTTTAANRMGLPNSSVYSASKAALRSLARTFSAELIGRGIRVNAVSPGPIETPIFGRLGMTQEEVGELAKVILGRVPAKRLGIPD